MGLDWDDVTRVGAGVATGGLSEFAYDDPFGSEGLGKKRDELIDPGADERKKQQDLQREMFERGMDLYGEAGSAGGQVNPYTGEIVGQGDSYLDPSMMQDLYRSGITAGIPFAGGDAGDLSDAQMLSQYLDPETGQLREDAPQEAQALFDRYATSYDPTKSEYYGFDRYEQGDPLELAKEREAVLQGDTNMQGVEADPLAIERQREAMGQMYDIANQGGLTAIDRARMEEARRDQNQWVRGQREANQQRMEARGMSGSGTQLVDDMIAAQQGAQRISQADLNTEAMAQQRQMDAIYGYGDMASGVRRQSFDEGARRAEAQDIIDRFNTSGRRGVQERDTARENEQRAANWERQIGVQDRNTELGHLEEERRANMPGRTFDRKARGLGIATGQGDRLAGAYEKEARGQEKVRDQIVGGGIGLGKTAIMGG